MPRLRPAALAVLLLTLLAATAHADPAGKTTLEETLARGDGAFGTMQTAPGERYLPRRVLLPLQNLIGVDTVPAVFRRLGLSPPLDTRA